MKEDFATLPWVAKDRNQLHQTNLGSTHYEKGSSKQVHNDRYDAENYLDADQRDDDPL